MNNTIIGNYKKMKVKKIIHFIRLNEVFSTYQIKYVNNGEIIFTISGVCYNKEIENMKNNEYYMLPEIDYNIIHFDKFDMHVGNHAFRWGEIKSYSCYKFSEIYKLTNSNPDSIPLKYFIYRDEENIICSLTSTKDLKYSVPPTTILEFEQELTFTAEYIRLNKDFVACHLTHDNFGKSKEKTEKYFLYLYEDIGNLEKAIDDNLNLDKIALFKKEFVETRKTENNEITPKYILEHPEELEELMDGAVFVKKIPLSGGIWFKKHIDYYTGERYLN